MHTLHKLKEGFVVTSDEEIKKGDIVVYKTGEIIKYDVKLNTDNLLKVIAQQDQIDFSHLPEEEQKKIGWFDVEESWEQDTKTTSFGETNKVDHFKNYKKGFQKAQELLSDRMFTLNDMRKAFLEGNKYPQESEQLPNFYLGNYFNKFIQSLSQPKSWKIEGEWKENKFFITKIK
jgi:hypothetical protein